MRTALLVLFWSWLAISLAVYGYRVWRRFAKRSSGEGALADTQAASVVSPPAPPTAPLPGATPAAPLASPDIATGERATTTPSFAGVTPGRAGIFADRSDAVEPPRVSRVAISDALAGIAMPCGLAPLVGDADLFSAFRAVFATTGATAAEVGAGLADQLEVLGYRLTTMADNEAVATRDATEVTVTVFTDLSRFPTAPAGSVVAVLAS